MSFLPIFISLFMFSCSLIGMNAQQEKFFLKKFNKDFDDKFYCSYFFHNYMTRSFDKDEITSKHITQVIALNVCNKSGAYSQLLSHICESNEQRFLDTIMTNDTFVAKIFTHPKIQQKVASQIKNSTPIKKDNQTQTSDSKTVLTKPIIPVSEKPNQTSFPLTQHAINLSVLKFQAKPWVWPKSSYKNFFSLALSGSNSFAVQLPQPKSIGR